VNDTVAIPIHGPLPLTEIPVADNCSPTKGKSSVSAITVQAIIKGSLVAPAPTTNNPETAQTADSLISIDPTSNDVPTLNAPHDDAVPPSEVPPRSSNEGFTIGSMTSPQAEPIQLENGPDDIVMSGAPKPHNDTGLPAWLLQMIKYLREVSEDVPWQDLVTDLVDFEKRGPPAGVSFFICLTIA